MKKRHLTLLMIGIVIIGAIIGLFFMFKINNEPAEGVIHQVEPGPVRNSEKKESKPITLDGKYVKFEYPNNYRKIASHKNTNLETINLLGRATSGGEIAVSVSQGSLAENSATRLRRLQKQIYSEQPLKLPNITGVVFTKQPPGFEKTAIIEHKGLIASIAISSSVGRDLSEIFDLVTKSFSWK